MQIAPFALRLAEASSTAHLDKVERGYENMDHYTVDFNKEGKALRSLDFPQGELVMAASYGLQLRLVVVRLLFPFLSFLQRMKTRMKRMRMEKQAPRKERGPRLFREAVLLQLPPSNLLPPSRVAPPQAQPRALPPPSCQPPTQTTP